MKKLFPLFLSLLFTLPGAVVHAQKRELAKQLFSPKALQSFAPVRIRFLEKVATGASSRILIQGKYLQRLPAFQTKITVAQPQLSLPQKVQRQAELLNQPFDLADFTLTDTEAADILNDFLQAGITEKPPLFLNAFPHLNVQRGYSITRSQHFQAVRYYRHALETALKYPVSSANDAVQLDAWGRQMASVSNLGLYGTGEDADLIIRIALNVPPYYRAATDIITARALLSLEAYTPLKQFAAVRAKDGLLPAHWQGISQYVTEELPSLDLPAVSTKGTAEVITKGLQNKLQEWNALNALHANTGAEATRDWINLRRAKGPTVDDAPGSSSAIAANASSNGPPAGVRPPSLSSATTVAPPPAAVAPEAAQAAVPPSAAQANGRTAIRTNFLVDASGRSGPLAQFCKTQNIPVANRTAEDILAQIASDPVLRDEFIRQVSRNDSGLAQQWIKGLSNEELIQLQSLYPPAGPNGISSQSLGKDLLELFKIYADPATGRAINNLLNEGYLFVSHFRAQHLFLGTEFHTSQLPELATYTREYNQIHGIKKSDFLPTFNPAVGKTAASSTPQIRVQEDRIFRFQGYKNEEFSFAELPDFLARHPDAVLQGTYSKNFRDGEFTNSKTGEVIIKKDMPNLVQETLDESLRPLYNLLRENGAEQVFLLQAPTARENFRFMYDRLQEMKPMVREHLQRILGGKYHIEFSHRFGQHEIEGTGNLVSLSNMHVHLEAYIPELKFTFNVSVPLRVSQAMKNDINALFEQWTANGSPNGSPVDYYGEPSVWERVTQKLMPKPATQTRPVEEALPASSYPEMYEGELNLAF